MEYRIKKLILFMVLAFIFFFVYPKWSGGLLVLLMIVIAYFAGTIKKKPFKKIEKPESLLESGGGLWELKDSERRFKKEVLKNEKN